MAENARLAKEEDIRNVFRTSYTWSEPGPLGLKLKDRISGMGLMVRSVTKEGLPDEIAGLCIECVNGVNVSEMDYDDNIAQIKGAGRPLTIEFRALGVEEAKEVDPIGNHGNTPRT